MRVEKKEAGSGLPAPSKECVMLKKSRKDSQTRNGEVVNGAVEREPGGLAKAVANGRADAFFWPAFPMGKVVVTRGIIAKVPMEEAVLAIERHGRCDWGDLCEEDRAANHAALRHDDRLLSKYRAPDGTEFYVITEWDRSYTTVLLTDEY